MFVRRFLVAAAVCLPLAACTPSQTIKEQNQPLQSGRQLSAAQAAADKGKASAEPAKAASTPEIRDDLPPMPTLDLTVPPTDLWQRIRNGFGMRDISSPLVADREAYYLNRPDTLRQIMQRSRKYLYYIVDELERRGMPTELALLPMIESAYNPRAYSRSRALGMWQFIPSTGKNYKLDQNWWRDERRDIIASTNAALDYLEYLYEMHGDWHLALASYNWGENAVARAIAKNKARGLPTDYASLPMPKETRYYLPKLQALKNIISQPELFGFLLDPLPNRPYFATVGLPGDMDVALAAHLAEMPVKDFIDLNPAYQRPVIHGDKDTVLLLPQDKLDVFNANLKSYTDQDKPLATWRTYRLKRHESLASVAKRYKISLSGLKRLNGIGRHTRVRPGLNLLVPGPHARVPAQLLTELPKDPRLRRTSHHYRHRHYRHRRVKHRHVRHHRRYTIKRKSTHTAKK